MKVENPQAAPTSAVGRFGAETQVRGARRAGAPTPLDNVQLSDSLSLAQAAIKAATPESGVRSEVVAEAQALLAQGEIGNDLERLANRMLMDVTCSHDDDSA